MALVDIVMPKMGESIMEATVLRWHKKPGDSVKMDETLLDIATDKVDSEVPSTAEGTLSEILCNENDVIAVGAVIARIQTTAGATTTTQTFTPPPPVAAPAPAHTEETIDIPYQPAGAKINSPSSGMRFYSPLVLNIAAQEGISMSELESIPGTGNEGRVTKKDILQYVSSGRKGASAPAQCRNH